MQRTLIDFVICLLIATRKKPRLIKIAMFYFINIILKTLRIFKKKYPCFGDVYFTYVSIFNFFRLPLFIENCYVRHTLKKKYNEAVNFHRDLNKLILNNAANTFSYLNKFFSNIKENVYYFVNKENDDENNKKIQALFEGTSYKFCSDDPVWFAINSIILSLKEASEEVEPEFSSLLDNIEVYKYYIYCTTYFNDVFVLETNKGYLCMINIFLKDCVYPSIRRKLIEENVSKALAFINKKENKLWFIYEEIADNLDEFINLLKNNGVKCVDKLYYMVA